MTVVTNARTKIISGWLLDEDGWNTAMNTNLQIMSRLGIGPNAISHGLAAPPASPANGDTYIVASANASGAWVGQENHIAYYDTNSWTFYEPFRGLMFYVASSQTLVVYDGSGWITAVHNAPTTDLNVQRLNSLRTDNYRGSTGGELGLEDRRALDLLKTQLSGTASTDVIRVANLTANGIYHSFSGATSRDNKESLVSGAYTLTGGTPIANVVGLYAGRGSAMYGALTVTNATYPNRLLIAMRYQRQDIGTDEDVIDVTTAAKGEVVRCTYNAVNIHETNTTQNETRQVTKLLSGGTPASTTRNLTYERGNDHTLSYVLPTDVSATNANFTIHVESNINNVSWNWHITIPSLATDVAQWSVIHVEGLSGNPIWTTRWAYVASTRTLTISMLGGFATADRRPYNFPTEISYQANESVEIHSNPGETRITDFGEDSIVNLAVLIDGSNSSAAKVTASAGNGVVSRTFGVGVTPDKIVIGGRSSIIQSLFIGTPAAAFDTKLLDTIALGWPVDGGAPENIITRSGAANALTFS